MTYQYLLFFCFTLGGYLFSVGVQANNLTDTAPTPPPLADKPAMQKPQGRMGGKPPSDAIEMCKGKAEKSSCTMNGPRGKEQGFCEHTPDKLYFACNPQRGPAGQAMPPRKGSHQNKVKTESNSGVSYFPLDKEASYLKSAS